jgi:hypothetical protein
LVKNILEDGDKERTFLILFQNNMELRPGGGFIGSFGIIKTKGEKIISYSVHDTSNFDGRIPDTVPIPTPMKEAFGINAWKLRDSNYSPDFKVNAEKALEFYYLGKGEEEFDGVIAINAALLESVLEFTGPIMLEGHPNTYTASNVLVSLEKQVEINYREQGIKKGDRKEVLGLLMKDIMDKVKDLSILEKTKLFKVIVAELNSKDIQLYFKDQELQSIVEDANWSGEVDRSWNNDYLMLVDANLGAYKSDYFVKRSLDYNIDFSQEKPRVKLDITYNHTAKEKNWFTQDYNSYTRVYVPFGSELISFGGFPGTKVETDFEKTYFANWVRVKTGEEKTIGVEYVLPEKISIEDYALKIQKQSGVENIPLRVTITSKDGKVTKFDKTMDGDLVLEE